jgi:hypothetical protein
MISLTMHMVKTVKVPAESGAQVFLFPVSAKVNESAGKSLALNMRRFSMDQLYS